MPRMDRLAGKVALITGGAGSIGAATARLFLAEGARVVVSDVEPVPDLGPGAVACVADVTDSAAVRAAVELCVSEFGGLDIAFANAGVFGSVATVEDYRRTSSRRSWRSTCWGRSMSPSMP
jgi:NAD(P)-dependent dehydrogenase (short-subunit alcohol dehydrogenase family)